MNKHNIYDTLIKAGIIIIVVFFAMVILIKRFVYFKPSSHFVPTREAYKPIHHGNLHGWLLEGEGDKIIVLCHGNAGNVSHCEGKMIALRNLGYSVLAFDYSGYGKSGGVPSEKQLYEDVSSIMTMLRQQYAPEQIILYGESLGCPIATYAARRFSIPVLILESPLPNMSVFIEHKFPLLAWLSFLFPEFNTAEYLHGYKGRSLLLHSPTDEVIPYTSTMHLQQMVAYHIPIDGSHDQPILPWNEIKKFIDT